ncbi:hypothetical protein CsSME_00050550 [Camellia sinensis var. sinensis]|uniref:Uncharacterized protein n=1 Tax=Camellia sinensis var. sinensis TaxID=542762 RepID=A0A4S4CYZ3_CAMSN|nr:hypothetical protein TEA_016976 [Camellia sinensis var. sinensis]
MDDGRSALCSMPFERGDSRTCVFSVSRFPADVNVQSCSHTIEFAKECYTLAICRNVHKSSLPLQHLNAFDSMQVSSEMCVLQSATGSAMELQEDIATWTFIIDGSWRAKGLRAGGAWICYDANWHVVGQYAMALHCPCSPLITQATACLEAVR